MRFFVLSYACCSYTNNGELFFFLKRQPVYFDTIDLLKNIVRLFTSSGIPFFLL